MKDKWIPVTERLPEEKGHVLVWVADTGAGWLDQAVVAFFDGGHDQDFDAPGILEDGGIVTHWQPIEPPQSTLFECGKLLKDATL